MTIITKLNLDQECYAMNKDTMKVSKGNIENISISIVKLKQSYHKSSESILITYSVSSEDFKDSCNCKQHRQYTESEIFSTKEDLLKSL